MSREFMDIFDQWASTYDEAVLGHDEQYKEVFEHYHHILETVASRSYGHVLEFGVGTGNLTEEILKNNLNYTGIEPNESMRAIAQERFPNETILDGDFLTFDEIKDVDTIISSYAFHHLTDDEKQVALNRFFDMLPSNGHIIFADTVFKSDFDYRSIIAANREKGFNDLADDLEREYYTTHPVMKKLFETAGFKVQFEQLNTFVWLIQGSKVSR